MNGLRTALAWMLFPLVPVVLAGLFFEGMNWSGADPRVWDWQQWVVLVGPLLGYGFLAGATLHLSDPERGWRGRRSVWVAVGPWAGFLFWAAVFWALVGLSRVVPPRIGEPIGSGLDRWLKTTWTGWAAWWVFVVALVASVGYGWLVPAVAALRRARRAGECLRALRNGAIVALTFVGSLFGTFWALTEGWRSFFFDPRVAPVVLAALTLLLLGGCGNPTVGEVRRRDLFHALLMAWVLGLALLWRWWARPRGK